MSEKIYVDTNVFLDYCLERKSQYRDFQDYANQLLNRTLSCEFYIVISDITLFELKKRCSLEFLEDLKHKLIFVKNGKNEPKFGPLEKLIFPEKILSYPSVLLLKIPFETLRGKMMQTFGSLHSFSRYFLSTIMHRII